MQQTGSANLGLRQWLPLAALLLFVLLADSYAMHRVYVARMGNALDFYPIWAGSRHVLLHHQNPYNQEVMRQNQQAIYGRPALPDENQHGYAYPAHAPFLLAPFLLLPFSYAAPLWIALQQMGSISPTKNRAPFHHVVRLEDGRIVRTRNALLSLGPEAMYAWH
jgi:hypothetical protein